MLSESQNDEAFLSPTRHSTFKWVGLVVILLAIVLIPFFLAGSAIESWTKNFIDEAAAHPWLCAAVLGGLLLGQGRVNPLLRIKTAQTVMTAGLLAPARASVGVTSPVMAHVPSASRATTSMGTHSVTNSNTAADNKLNTKIISGVIFASSGTIPFHRPRVKSWI